MSVEQEIEQVLLDLGKTIHIHKIDDENSIIEINYDKHLDAIMNIFHKYRGNLG